MLCRITLMLCFFIGYHFFFMSRFYLGHWRASIGALITLCAELKTSVR